MGAKKSYGSQEEEHKPFKERIAERAIAHQARYDRRRRPRAGRTVPRITCHPGALASRCHRLESTAYAELSELPARIPMHRPVCPLVVQRAWPLFRGDHGPALSCILGHALPNMCG